MSFQQFVGMLVVGAKHQAFRRFVHQGDEGIEIAGGTAFPVACDVTDAADLPRALDAIEGKLGVIDILINNAGLAGEHGFLGAPAEETARVFEVNQAAVWNVAQHVCQRLCAAEEGGAVVNISSIAGLRAVGGAASYAVSKAAVAHMTRIRRSNLRATASG